MQTITNLEKLVTKKKFAVLLAGVITKPPGKPALAPVDDKRPECDPAAMEFNDLDMEESENE